MSRRVLPLTGPCNKCGSTTSWGWRARARRDGTVYLGRYCIACDRAKARRRRTTTQDEEEQQ